MAWTTADEPRHFLIAGTVEVAPRPERYYEHTIGAAHRVTGHVNGNYGGLAQSPIRRESSSPSSDGCVTQTIGGGKDGVELGKRKPFDRVVAVHEKRKGGAGGGGGGGGASIPRAI